LQLLLPAVLADFLPVDVRGTLAWPALVTGLAMGLGVTILFSLAPLLAIRHVSPLVVLRREYEDTSARRRDPARLLAAAALASCVVAMASWQAASLPTGLAFSAGIGIALVVLWLAARALAHAVRRWFPSRWPYVWRQGIANLHRPANQTATVILALGFGAFLLDTLLVVQHNLLRDLSPGEVSDRPNMVLFDIQPDQRAPIEEDLRRAGVPHRQAVPVVPMRIQSVKGVSAESLLARSGPRKAAPGDPTPWTLRREYRSTYRDHLTKTERMVAGEEWTPGAWRTWRPGAESPPVPISLEVDVARELGVSVGDTIVWDIQGLSIPSRVTSLRDVHWARLEPNFFVVFPEGPLDPAPQTFATLSRVEDPDLRARVQRRIVETFPNVTSLDLSQVQQAVEQVVGKAALAVRFMALFSLAAGTLVLVGALATSRYQRVREAVLLKTLGATRAQLVRIALAEYLSLGSLGAVAALALSLAAGWGLVRFVFQASFTIPAGALLLLALAMVILTVIVGIGGSLEVLRKPPLEALRAE
jgi:putative ABC transport system permease protein